MNRLKLLYFFGLQVSVLTTALVATEQSVLSQQCGTEDDECSSDRDCCSGKCLYGDYDEDDWGKCQAPKKVPVDQQAKVAITKSKSPITRGTEGDKCGHSPQAQCGAGFTCVCDSSNVNNCEQNAACVSSYMRPDKQPISFEGQPCGGTTRYTFTCASGLHCQQKESEGHRPPSSGGTGTCVRS